MIVLDTSVVVAYMNQADSRHVGVAEWIDSAADDLVTTPLVLAEIDHLVSRYGGERAAQALRADLAAGAYLVDWWAGALQDTLAVAERYGSLELGLVDASLVALAGRVATVEVATLDERHFRVLRPLRGGTAFTVLPADES